MEPSVSLLMLSGGVDSTHALKQILTKTNDRIFVHHVHMVNSEGRHRPEARAARSIVDYMRAKLRNFAYSESLVNRSTLSVAGYDVITIAGEAGVVANNILLKTGYPVERLIIGTNQEEEDAEARDVPDRLPHFLAALAASSYPNPPPRFETLEILPKAQLVHELEKELLEMCWTCRRPLEVDGIFVACRRCKTCQLMREIHEGSARTRSTRE